MKTVGLFTILATLSFIYYRFLVKACVGMSAAAFKKALESMAANGIALRELQKDKITNIDGNRESENNFERVARKLGVLNGIATGYSKSMKFLLLVPFVYFLTFVTTKTILDEYTIKQAIAFVPAMVLSVAYILFVAYILVCLGMILKIKAYSYQITDC